MTQNRARLMRRLSPWGRQDKAGRLCHLPGRARRSPHRAAP